MTDKKSREALDAAFKLQGALLGTPIGTHVMVGAIDPAARSLGLEAAEEARHRR